MSIVRSISGVEPDEHGALNIEGLIIGENGELKVAVIDSSGLTEALISPYDGHNTLPQGYYKGVVRYEDNMELNEEWTRFLVENYNIDFLSGSFYYDYTVFTYENVLSFNLSIYITYGFKLCEMQFLTASLPDENDETIRNFEVVKWSMSLPNIVGEVEPSDNYPVIGSPYINGTTYLNSITNKKYIMVDGEWVKEDSVNVDGTTIIKDENGVISSKIPNAHQNNVIANNTGTAFGRDTESTGDVAFASGAITSASGEYSFASGYNSKAVGVVSTATGDSTKAEGRASHSEGKETLAVGANSHAEGEFSKAEGENSHSEGYNTTASGRHSHAEGINTVASGIASHAEGGENTASGNNSHAEGRRNVASVLTAHAEGEYALATGGQPYAISSVDDNNKTVVLEKSDGLVAGDIVDIKIESSVSLTDIKILVVNDKTVTLDTTKVIASASYIIKKANSSIASHAEGKNTLASGEGSHAEGMKTKAVAPCAHSEGWNTLASGNNAHAEGGSTIARGSASHAEGWETIANGNNSHAEGYKSMAGGNNSHAEGDGTFTSGISSHAEGKSTMAMGTYSHAEGEASYAGGWASHAEGNGTNASANYSHAEGMGTDAYGVGSHAGGISTIANNYTSMAIGHCSNMTRVSENSFNTTATAFVIGNGTGENVRSNAFRVTFDGKVYGRSAYNSSGADYAEYWEWEDGNANSEDRVGYFVTTDDNLIRKAKSADKYILGVVSVNPSVIGDSASEGWNERYLKDEFGRIQYHYVNVEHEERNENEDLVKVVKSEYHPIYNPNYDPTAEYTPRENRKEWDAVGHLGKLLVRDDGTCVVGGFCYSNDEGIATKSEDGYRVLERISDNIVKIFVK